MVFYNGADVKAGTRWIFSGPKQALVGENVVCLSVCADNHQAHREPKKTSALRQDSVKLLCVSHRWLMEKAFRLNHVGWVS